MTNKPLKAENLKSKQHKRKARLNIENFLKQIQKDTQDFNRMLANNDNTVQKEEEKDITSKNINILRPLIYGSVFVQGSFMNRATKDMFLKHGGFKLAENIKDADFVVWTGGEDINPDMYNEKALPYTSFSTVRDIEDVTAYQEASKDAFKIGICRGAQLLCVLNGGKLWQDVDKHANGSHDVKDVKSGDSFKINSLHHQQMRMPDKRGEILAFTRLSSYKDAYQTHWTEAAAPDPLKEIDIEAAWFEETFSLCYQAHPEFSHGTTRDYFFHLIDRFVFANEKPL